MFLISTRKKLLDPISSCSWSEDPFTQLFKLNYHSDTSARAGNANDINYNFILQS